MSTHTRELLLNTKAARQWNSAFDEQVDAIIDTINRVDTLDEVARTTEVLDVYHHTSIHTARHNKRARRLLYDDRPFEFLTFRN